MTNYSGTSIDGLGLQFVIDILIKSLGNQSGPFHPKPPLPPILTLLQQDEVSMDVTDSLVNNIFDAYYLAVNPEWDLTTNGWKVKVNLLSSPQLYFTDGAGDDADEIIMKAKLVLSKFPLHFTVTSTIISHFEIEITPQGQLFLQISPTDFVVSIDSVTPPLPNSTKNFIENQIENTWASIIPGVNQKLLEHMIQLPRVADFSDPEIIYRNGYAYFSFDSLPSARPTADSNIPMEAMTRSITEASLESIVYGDQRTDGCPNLSFFGVSEITCN